MKQKTRSIVLMILAAAVLILGGAAVLNRSRLQAWAYNHTGEEELFGQVRGAGQLVLNAAQPRLKLAPYAPMNDTGVNPFGINTFLHQEVEPAKREQQMQLISEAGFTWIREEFPWEDIEIHERGDFMDRRNDPDGVDAWQKYDEIVELADEYDVQIIARLSNPPSWSRAAGDEIGSQAPPDDFDDYANYAAAVAERYEGQITYFQLWNEPNIYPEWGEQAVDPEAYTDLLCRAYAAIKEANPEAVVLSAALAPTIALDGRDLNDLIFLQRMYDAGASDCFDILAVQAYMLWSGPTDERMDPVNLNYGHVEYVRDVMVRNGDEQKAIWITEMNANAAPLDVEPRYGRVTLAQQARYAPLAYQRAQEQWPFVGVVAFWYFKRADTIWLDEKRPEAYFQMSDPDFNLMPVYDSMAEYANQPPVMYMGRHAADHWAVQYGDGWSAGADGGMAASEGAEAISVTFDGASFAVSLVEGSQISYRVDGGPAQTVTASGGSLTLWRGARGEHTVIIEPQGNVTLGGFTVQNEPPVNAWLAVGLGLVAFSGLGYFVHRRQNA